MTTEKTQYKIPFPRQTFDINFQNLGKLTTPEQQGKITLTEAISIHNGHGVAALVEALQKGEVTNIDLKSVTKATLKEADPSFIFVLRALYGPLPASFLSLVRDNWCPSDITRDMFFALSSP